MLRTLFTNVFTLLVLFIEYKHVQPILLLLSDRVEGIFSLYKVLFKLVIGLVTEVFRIEEQE